MQVWRKAMEILLLVLGLFGSGVVAKAGEDTFDVGRKLLTQKLSGTPTGNALEAGAEIDPEQAVIDVEAIATDEALQALQAKLKTLVSENAALQEQLEKIRALQKQVQRNTQISREQSQAYQFNGEVKADSIGGNHTHHHYHGVDPEREH